MTSEPRMTFKADNPIGLESLTIYRPAVLAYGGVADQFITHEDSGLVQAEATLTEQGRSMSVDELLAELPLNARKIPCVVEAVRDAVERQLEAK